MYVQSLVGLTLLGMLVFFKDLPQKNKTKRPKQQPMILRMF